MKNIRVYVTARDIDIGRRWSVTSCPVALAVGRAFGRRARVNPDSIKVGGRKKSFRVPAEAKDFILAFDSGGRTSLQPFSFTLGN